MASLSKKYKILIVSDQSEEKLCLTNAIDSSDLSVETDFISSGHEAMSLLKKHTFDCVFIGLGLTDINGLELLNKINEFENAPPLLAVSLTNDDFKAPETIKHGASDFITKALCTPEFISQSIRNVIRTNNAEKKQLDAEKALKEREELYRFLSENSKDLICLQATDGKFLFLTNAVKDLLGYSTDELINTYPDELYHPTDKQRVLDFVTQESNVDSTSNTVEYRFRKKDGSYVWLETSIKPIRNELSELIKFQSTSRDITVRKLSDNQINRAYTKITDLKNLLEGLLDSSLSGVMAFKSVRNEKNEITDFEWLLINQSAEKMLSRKSVDLKGKRLLLEQPKNKEDGLFDLYVRVVESGEPLSHEHYYGHGNLKTWFQTVAVKLNDGFAVTITNITDRKKAEFLHFHAQFELEKQKEFFLQVINTNPNLIFVKDWDGRYTLANTATAELLGTTVEDLIDKTDADFNINAQEVAEDLIKDREVIKAGTPVKIEAQIRSKTQGHRWYHIIKVPLKMTDDSVQALGIAADITERKEAEKELLEAKETAEQSLSVKEQFLANMSHEIRTPMNAIIGFTDLLKKSQLNKNQSEFIDAIATSGENLLTIINDILDFSKIESGKLEIETIPFNIKETIRTTASLLLPKAKEKNISYSIMVSDDIPSSVLGDSARLSQILINLIGNSVKFTEKGQISISAIVDQITNGNVKIKFVIKDTGIGIAKEKHKTVFERFTQASGETTRKFGGTGLGLSIVKSLIELQNGEVFLESELNHGSTFTFYISYDIVLENTENSSNKSDYTKISNIRPNIRILVAEDNLMNQKLVKNVLVDFGFDVDIVENGKLAIEKHKLGHYDVILMDMQMPEMDGYEATKILRNELNSNVPIIAMTAHAMTGEKEKCIKLGMNDYISKPFKADDLYTKILSFIKDEDIIDSINDCTMTNSNQIEDNNNPIIDLSYLKSLPGANDDFVKEMIDLFVDDTPLELKKIETAIEQQDFPSIKRVSHKMKTSVSFMGLNQIVPLLKEMETLSTSESNIECIITNYNQVAYTCNKAIEELKTKQPNS